MINLPKTMRGVWLTGHGDMDKLEIRQDIPVPAPGPQDVLIRVAAASVNNTDINTRVAWYSKQDGASEDASWSGQAIGFPLIEKLGADSVDVVIDLVAGNQWPQYLKRNHLQIPKGKMMRIKKISVYRVEIIDLLTSELGCRVEYGRDVTSITIDAGALPDRVLAACPQFDHNCDS